VVDAFVKAATLGGNQVINIGTGEELSVNVLFSTMAEAAGSTLPPVHAEARPGELLRSCLVVDRAAKELGWKASTSFFDGATTTLAFVADQLGKR
jgi:UDP-glucose 4-epimerase